VPRSLLKILGTAFGLAVIIGNTIGAGILRTPGDIAASLGTPALFLGIWILGALYATCGANALAELGTMMPRSGAQYVFARHAFGDYMGFLVGWTDWMSTAASVSAISFVFASSVAALVPLLTDHTVAIAISTVLAFTLLLMRGTKVGDRAQQITSLFKTAALLVFVGACFVFGGHAASAPAPTASTSPVTTTPLLVGLVLSAQAVIYTYDGWNGVLYFSEELEQPGRQIPRAMFGGLLLIALVYLLVNAAFVYAAPLSSIAGSPLAAATIATTIFGPIGERVVNAVVVIALPSAINANLLMDSRVLFGMSRDGLGPSSASQVGARGTPIVALLATCAVVVVMLATGTFQIVVAIAAFFFVLQYTISFVALFVLRRREPGAPRPYRALGHPWTTGLVLVGSVAFLVGAVTSDQRNSVYALGLLVVSYPVFLGSRLLRSAPAA
jgi:basic amino acid/polyamine antiporter, APA family